MSEACYRVISDLENHPSRLNKEAILLEQAEAGNNELFSGLVNNYRKKRGLPQLINNNKLERV
jgi:hypothetical protein